MSAQKQRIETAAAEFFGYTPNPTTDDQRLMNTACRYTAKRILEAGDAVLFSEEAMERITNIIWESHGNLNAATIAEKIVTSLTGASDE